MAHWHIHAELQHAVAAERLRTARAHRRFRREG